MANIRIGGGSCWVKVNGRLKYKDKKATLGRTLTVSFPQAGHKPVKIKLKKGDCVKVTWR